MPASLPHWALPGARSTTARKRLIGGLLTVALLGSAGLAGRFMPDRLLEPRPSPVQLKPVAISASARLELEQCVRHAFLLYDVHWAAACTVAAQEDQAKHAACLNDTAVMTDPQRGKDYCDRTFAQRDFIECDLPDARAASVNALLREEEQKCHAAARAGS